jgi:cytochrome c biogenesis factor
VAVVHSRGLSPHVKFQGSSDGVSGDFTIYYNPLVMWVWIGGAVLGIGTLIALLPNQTTNRKAQPVNAKESEKIEEKVQ